MVHLISLPYHLNVNQNKIRAEVRDVYISHTHTITQTLAGCDLKAARCCFAAADFLTSAVSHTSPE